MKIEFRRRVEKNGDKSVYLFVGGSAVTCYTELSTYEAKTEAEKKTKGELEKWVAETVELGYE